MVDVSAIRDMDVLQPEAEELDTLLESLLDPPSSPSSSAASTTSTADEYALDECVPRNVQPTAAPIRKPLFRAKNEAQRYERRKQRNRDAAATSRARKKALVESLQTMVDDLKEENYRLRRCLSRHGLMDETDEQLGRWPCPRPAALRWTGSRKRNSQPLPDALVSILFALTMVLRLIASSSEGEAEVGDSELAVVSEAARTEQ